jgi:hypothetical protein
MPETGQAVPEGADQDDRRRQHGDIPPPGQSRPPPPLPERDRAANERSQARILDRQESQVSRVVNGPESHDLPVQPGIMEQRPPFVGGIAESASDGHIVRLPPAMMQPIAADDVAAALAEVATSEAENGTVEIAGPELVWPGVSKEIDSKPQPWRSLTGRPRRPFPKLSGNFPILRRETLIGVNSDPDREKLNRRLAEEKITWRSFWNGPKRPDGPISRAWNVRTWPTIYVLDDKGLIRYKEVQDKKLDEAVDELLGKLEQEQMKGLR